MIIVNFMQPFKNRFFLYICSSSYTEIVFVHVVCDPMLTKNIFLFIKIFYFVLYAKLFHFATDVRCRNRFALTSTFPNMICQFFLLNWKYASYLCWCLRCNWRLLLRLKLAVQSSHLKGFCLGGWIFSDFKPKALQSEFNSLKEWAFFAWRNSSFQSCADIRKKSSMNKKIMDLWLQLYNFLEKLYNFSCWFLKTKKLDNFSIQKYVKVR